MSEWFASEAIRLQLGTPRVVTEEDVDLETPCQYAWSDQSGSDQTDPHSVTALLRQLAHGDQFTQECAWLELESVHQHLLGQILPCVVDMVESPSVANKGYLLRILVGHLLGLRRDNTESAQPLPEASPKFISRVVENIRKNFHHSQSSVRSEAVSALGLMLGHEAIPEIESQLRTETDGATTIACIQALQRLNAQHAVPLIASYIRSNQSDVQTKALIALSRLIPSGFSEDTLDLLIGAMIVAAETRDTKRMIECFQCIHDRGVSAVDRAVHIWIERSTSIPPSGFVDFAHRLLLFAFFRTSFPVSVEQITPNQWLVLRFLANNCGAWASATLPHQKQPDDAFGVTQEQSSVEWQLEQMGIPSNGKDFASWVQKNQPASNTEN